MKKISVSVMMLVAMVVATMTMTGCTRYHVKRSDGTELSVISSREFPNGLKVKYQGDNGTGLEIEAGSVQNDSKLDSIVASAVAELLTRPREE